LSNEDLTPPKKKEFIRIINQQINNLSGMVNELQTSFKKITSSMELNKTTVNLKELCDEIFCCFKGTAESRKIDFKFNFDSSQKEICCDLIKLTELISNLLTNAFKYTEEGKISFDIYENDNYLCFEISDTGIGLDEKNIEKIFDKFYRVEEIKNNKEGSGLGLFIAKKIALAHNGDIFVESSVGVGTKFTFVLPKDF